MRFKKVIKFLLRNPDRKLYIKAVVISALFRFCIITVPTKYLQRYMGIRSEESAEEEPPEVYERAVKISYIVNRICDHTPWESKCLVRALTAQYFLKKNKISSTLYLGVGKKDEAMIAHAWLRTGLYYITGGNGNSYTMVAKFRS